MNILPKKSWHVRTKKNIERVRKDEAKAAEEEKELQRRIRLAEQEARTELLRKKARKDSDLVSQLDTRIQDHVNFFKGIEENGVLDGKNKEHEAEEKAIKEKFEKDMGILTYLGQSSLEAKGETPWYLKSISKDLTAKDGKDETASVKRKTELDPMNEIKKYISMKKGNYLETSAQTKDKHSKQPEKKSNSSSSKQMSKMEELRAKRLKRETEERNKSRKFLETLRKGPAVEEVILDDRLRKYNSQFNPEFARNNLGKEYQHK